jgi:hypothetical protein
MAEPEVVLVIGHRRALPFDPLQGVCPLDAPRPTPNAVASHVTLVGPQPARDDAGVSEPETVLDAVRLLEQEGYTANTVVLPDGKIRCGACERTHTVAGALVERVYRFEGTSDPDDEAIVLGVQCPGCGEQGVIVSAFGPAADPAVLENLVLLEDRFRERD